MSTRTTAGPTIGRQRHGDRTGVSGAASPRRAATAAARRRRWADLGLRHAVLILSVAFALFPIVFVISAAVNPLGTLSSTSLFPSGASLENLTTLFRQHPFAQWYVNSIVIAALASGCSLFLSLLAAYAFSRMRFTGRRVGLMSVLLIQMFPQMAALVAIFLMFSRITDFYPAIGLNTWWGLILLYLGGALGVNTWLTKGFLDTVPKELDESAIMDGASHVQAFFRIIVPLVTPILAITALLSFISTINEFLYANVFLTNLNSKTLAVGLYGLIAGERNNNFGIFAVGTLLTAVPTVVVFQFLQRYIVSGLTAGAVKG